MQSWGEVLRSVRARENGRAGEEKNCSFTKTIKNLFFVRYIEGMLIDAKFRLLCILTASSLMYLDSNLDANQLGQPCRNVPESIKRSFCVLRQ